MSRLAVCVDAAAQFLLSPHEAQAIIDRQAQSIRDNWQYVCDEADLSAVDREFLWERQFLNPYAFFQ